MVWSSVYYIIFCYNFPISMTVLTKTIGLLISSNLCMMGTEFFLFRP